MVGDDIEIFGINEKIQEYSEDVDFQLSTVHDEQQLFYYYLICILHKNGYRGRINTEDLHPTTLNFLLKEVQRTQRKFPKENLQWNISV